MRPHLADLLGYDPRSGAQKGHEGGEKETDRIPLRFSFASLRIDLSGENARAYRVG